MIMDTKLATTLMVAVAIAAVGAVLLTPALTAHAAISCNNPGGNEPPGNQGKDKCNGPALVNENPAGNQPAGWNK